MNELNQNRPDIDAAPRTSQSRSGRTQRRVGLGALILLGSMVAIGIWFHWREHRQVVEAAEQHRDFTPSVRVAAVRPSEGFMLVHLPGTTDPFDLANIYARASGYVLKRYVDIGSKVHAGDILAEITAPELDHQVAQAEATLAQQQAALRQVQANRDLARLTNARTAKLVSEGWVSRQQGDTDRLNFAGQAQAVQAAQATIGEGEAQLRVLQQQKQYQRVVAPFDGVIVQRNIDVGSLVQADATSGTAMFALMRSKVVRIQLYVPQDEAFGLTQGVSAIVRVPEIPGRDFPGTVSRVADALQQDSRTLLTEIDVPNPDGALVPGTYCTVELRIPRRTPSLIVPAEAIVFDRDGLHVDVVEDGHAHARRVTVARDFGTEVEIREGIKEGDRVILNPPVDLVDGAKI